MKISRDKVQAFEKFYKIILPTALTFLSLIIPVGLFHELGHALICSMNGHTFTIGFDGINFTTQCSHPTEPVWLIRSMGGIFGTIASFSPLIIRKIRDRTGILLGFISSGFSQGLIGLSETFVNSWYLSPNSKPSLTIFAICFMLLIVLKYGMRKETTSKSA